MLFIAFEGVFSRNKRNSQKFISATYVSIDDLLIYYYHSTDRSICFSSALRAVLKLQLWRFHWRFHLKEYSFILIKVDLSRVFKLKVRNVFTRAETSRNFYINNVVPNFSALISEECQNSWLVNGNGQKIRYVLTTY